jgi:radical SAM protein with 4Fe4S-binding SPASM domain
MHEELGMTHINQNFIMEDMGCTEEDYEKLKKEMDLCIEYVLGKRDRLYWSMIDERFLKRIGDPDVRLDEGWCGSGAMPALAVNGKIYPCFRWLPHTQEKEEKSESYCVGDVWNGLNQKENFRKIREATRDKISPPKCLECEFEPCCSYCLTPDTPILMADFTEKPIKDIEIGDKIIAFDEFPMGRGTKRKYRIAIVEKTFEREIDEDIYVDNKDYGFTSEHPFLSKRLNDVRFEKLEDVVSGRKKIFKSDVPSLSNDIFENEEYIKGYIIAAWIGDGTRHKYPRQYVKKDGYNSRDSYIQHSARFVVKDIEIMDRMKKYITILGLKFKEYPFHIAGKGENKVYVNGIFIQDKENYNKLSLIHDDNFLLNTNPDYLKGFLAGIYDTEGSISHNILRIFNTDVRIISEIRTACLYYEFFYNIEYRPGINLEVEALHIRHADVKRFFEITRPACLRKYFDFDHHSSIPTSLEFGNEFKKIHYTGKVHNLKTSTHTYIGGEYLLHNCIGGCYSEFGCFKRTTHICEITKLQAKAARKYWTRVESIDGTDNM